jgi:hypothetical protein
VVKRGVPLSPARKSLSGIVFGRVPLSLSHRRRSISLDRCHLPTSTRRTFSLADRVDQRLWMDCDHRLRKPSRQPTRCEHRGQQQRRSSTPPSRGVSLVHRFHIHSICCQLLDEQHPAVPEHDGLARSALGFVSIPVTLLALSDSHFATRLLYSGPSSTGQDGQVGTKSYRSDWLVLS